MLERYKPQNSLRNKQKQSLQPRTQDYSSLLQAQILGAQRRRLQKQVEEAQKQADNQIQPTQFTDVAKKESQMQAGGTSANLGIQTPPNEETKRSKFRELGTYLDRSAAFGAGLIGKVAAEKIPFTKDKTFGDILSNLGPYSTAGIDRQRDTTKGGLINTAEELGKQLNEKGVSYNDILSGLKIASPSGRTIFGDIYTDPISGLNYKKDKDGNPTDELTDYDKFFVKYNETDLGNFEGTGPILEAGMNVLGMSTQNSFLENFAGIATQGKTTASPEKLRGAIASKFKGTELPQAYLNAPDVSRKFTLELFAEPLNVPEIGALVKYATKGIIKSPNQIIDELVAKTSSDGRRISDTTLTDYQANEVIDYKKINEYVEPSYIAPRAGINVSSSRNLGLTRQELIDITKKLEEQITTDTYLSQSQVKKIQGEDRPIGFGYINGNKLNPDDMTTMLKQVNNLLINDDVIKNKLVDLPSWYQPPSTNFRTGEKTRLKIAKNSWRDDLQLEDILKADDVGETLPEGNKLFTKIKGFGETIGVSQEVYTKFNNITKFAADVISPRLNIPSVSVLRRSVAGKAQFTNPSEYIEAVHFTDLHKRRSLADMIEKSEGFLNLQAYGNPFITTKKHGVIQINDLKIDADYLKSFNKQLKAGEKIIPSATVDGQPVFLTSDFIGKFFTTKGNQQYWKLIAPSVQEARNHQTGRWITQYQKMFEERAAKSFDLGLLDIYDPKVLKELAPGETIISRIGSEINYIMDESRLLNPKAYDAKKLRVFTSQEAAEAQAKGIVSYQQDPFDILRIFANNEYTKQFDFELFSRVSHADMRLSTTRLIGEEPFQVTPYDDLVRQSNNLETNLNVKTIETEGLNKYQITKARNLFPEAYDDIVDAQNFIGRDRVLGYDKVRKKINKLKKDPTSEYNQRLNRISKLNKEYQDNQALYKSFLEVFNNDPSVLTRKAQRFIRENPRIARGLDLTAEDKAINTNFSNLARNPIVDAPIKLSEGTVNRARFLTANGDLSAPGIQGQFLLATNPKAWGQATKLMVESMGHPQVQAEFLLKHTDTIDELLKYNVPLGSRTSDFYGAFEAGGRGSVSRWSKTVTDKTLGRLERAYTTFMDDAKIMYWEAHRPLAQNAKELEDLASVVRHGFGAMDTAAMGVGQTQRSIENTILFFSPRLTRGMAALVGDSFRGGLRGNLARESISKIVMFQALMMKQLADVTNGSVNLDPTSPNFGTVKFADGRTFGFAGTLIAPLKLLLDTAYVTFDTPSAWTKGDFWKLGKADIDGKIVTNPIMKFARSKSSLLGARGWDLYTGTNYMGQETNIKQMAKDSIPLPFSLQAAYIDDFNRGLRDPDLSLPVLGDLDFYWLQSANFLGLKEFPTSHWDILTSKRDELAAKYYPKSKDGLPAQWKDLNEVQRLKILNPLGYKEINDKPKYAKDQRVIDAEALKSMTDMAYDSTTFVDPRKPEAVDNYYKQSTDINNFYSGTKEGGTIHQITKDLIAGKIDFYTWRNKRAERLSSKYERLEQERSSDPEIQEYFDSKTVPENTLKERIQEYSEEVFNNPEFDLPDGEHDYQAQSQADKRFLDKYGQEVYDLVTTVNYYKKDLNEYEAEFVIGKHIFGGKYYQQIDQATLEQFPDVVEDFNKYKQAGTNLKASLKENNPRLKQFLTVRTKVRELEREKNPLLDAWLYRMGYVSVMKNEANKDLEFEWGDPSSAIDWPAKWNQRKEEYPEYY